MGNLNTAKDKLKELEDQDKAEIAKRTRYNKLTYAQVLQEPENKERLKRDEARQEEAFNTIIKRHHPNLIPQLKDLFAEYYLDFLKSRVVSINDFLQEDKLDPNRKLKKQHNHPIKQ